MSGCSIASGTGARLIRVSPVLALPRPTLDRRLERGRAVRFAMAVGISTVMAIVTGTDVELIPVLVSEDPETLQL